MTRIGKVVMSGALIGFMLVTVAMTLSTGSNLAFIVGLLFGVPVGIVGGVIAGAIWSKEPHSGDFVFWWIVAAVMVAYLLVFAVIIFLNWKNGLAS
jgi:hypothetical protein